METKSSRLKVLRESGFSEYILPLVILRRSDLSLSAIESSVEELNATSFIVRSSAADEDQGQSNAGKYLSLLDIKKNDLYVSVELVFKSYPHSNMGDEVFIQPFLKKVTRSGVVFTKDPNTGSKYYVINSNLGFDTTAVTSGSKNGVLEVVFPTALSSISNPVINRNSELLKVVKRIESFYDHAALDIEFAEDGENLYILQVRPLAIDPAVVNLDTQSNTLTQIQNLVLENQKDNPFLLGATSYFGIMPDWNPAELIGIRPTRLAISLFKELITDGIWAYERGNLGYRNVRSFPLLIEFAGQPYVDVRASFNSLIPSSLDSAIAEKLVDYYLEKLKCNPHFDDKVESEIVLSSFTFDLKSKTEDLPTNFTSFEKNEIFEVLRIFTSKMIKNEGYGLNEILLKSKPLEQRFNQVMGSELDNTSRIYWLMEDCKRYGTLPFAGMARLAFIATGLVSSLVEVGVLSEDEVHYFLSSIKTVTSELIDDWASLDSGKFIARYGHLRPGTYDIRVLNYASNFEYYFDKSKVEFGDQSQGTINVKDILSKIEESGILDELDISIDDFVKFVQKSISAREEIKFLYTRNISAVLDLVSDFATKNGLSREDAAHVDIRRFLDAYRESTDLNDLLLKDISDYASLYKVTQSIWLPPLICGPDDIYAFEISNSHPNYISHKSVFGRIVLLDSDKSDLSDCIVLIERADPGYDWIFTKKISGFITCYGGANSHMAVRAKELGIPAAVGVGQLLFERLKSRQTVFLDCINKRINL